VELRHLSAVGCAVITCPALGRKKEKRKKIDKKKKEKKRKDSVHEEICE